MPDHSAAASTISSKTMGPLAVFRIDSTRPPKVRRLGSIVRRRPLDASWNATGFETAARPRSRANPQTSCPSLASQIANFGACVARYRTFMETLSHAGFLDRKYSLHALYAVT